MPLILNGDGSISGTSLQVDSPTFVVDDTNNRVGVGVASPTQPLQVQGNSFLNGEVVVGRTNSTDEGGQISFSRAADNAAYWNIDAFGSTSTPTLRFFNDGTVKMQIDSSGRVTIPNQPAFFANKTASTSANNFIVSYDDIKYNNGGHFNASTGRFTAPVSGIYVFVASQLTNIAPSTVYFAKNGSYPISGWWNRPSAVGGEYDMSEKTIITSLVSGDYISLYALFAAYSDVNGWTTFGGYLLA